SAKIAEEIAGIEEERTELERRLALETSRANAAFRQKQKELNLLELVLREQQMKINSASMNTQYALTMADKRDQLSRLAPEAVAPKYLKEPFVDGTLYISDRRVTLNGPVTAASAKAVCDRLYFFNNQNPEYPIFLVIDHSPGGSVAAGYQIQKAMQSCTAPVYVVVKNMAASMAAVIATTAERSFCFANTRILHHQISSGVEGNLTVMREGVAMGELWYKRFGEPVAKKMGITLEEFTKQMYANNSDGDWVESGHRAVELKWIDHVVDRIEETGIISVAEKTAKPPRPQMPVGLTEETDAQGRRYVELPVLENPLDFWAIYDKNNYYRTR
ncbi:MAG: ATP-dependent Clp protease proteolytic subunit, partial [Opitutales bacterium]|nr:ATP-dependent Clp protease proteolytic subunit [Opitutales bacterium]